MKALSREFWEKMAEKNLKEWDSRECNPGSREYLKLNAKAERASTILQMLDTMDAGAKVAVKQTWIPMSEKCVHGNISMVTHEPVCAHGGWTDMPICFIDICPLLKEE